LEKQYQRFGQKMHEVILHDKYEMPDGSEKEHIYTVNDVIKPGASDVLSESGFSNPFFAVYTRASLYGDAAHAAICLDLAGTLGTIDESPEFQNTFAAYRQWREDYDPEIIFFEKSIYSEHHGYCGTPDLFCKIKGKYCLPDWKSGGYDPITTPLKMIAYEHLVREEEFITANTKIDKFLVLLSSDEPKRKSEKRYKIVSMNDPLAAIAWQSCLNIHRWKNRRI